MKISLLSLTKLGGGDLVMAFFPCIYFECLSMMAFNWGCVNYRKLTYPEKTEKIIKRATDRYNMYVLLLKFVKIVMEREIRMVFENPYAMQHYLKQGNFVKNPDVVDNNRMLRGDYFVKPTAYWFFNCTPTHGYSYQKDKEKKIILKAKSAPVAGLCSEERSKISPDYARNFICDFIIGQENENTILTLF